MRLVTYRPADVTSSDSIFDRVALILPSGRYVPLVLLARLAPDVLSEEIDTLDMTRVLALDPDGGALRMAVRAAGTVRLEKESFDPADVRLVAPIPRPGKIVGVGYNYLDHLREQGLEKPARPTLFSMFSNAVAADGDPIRKPGGTHALDLEAELAVVIGKRASRVPVERAMRHVAGYTAANDITARDWQGQAKALRPGEKGDGQWLRAKGSDGFLPLGPVLVTADELGDGRGLTVRSWHTAAAGRDAGHEVQMQDGNTKDLLFGVDELISMISAEVTLEPGDIIVTGTPSGVGVFRDPPVFLEPGDVIRVEVEGIGSLTNPIVDETGHALPGSPAARAIAARTAEAAYGR